MITLKFTNIRNLCCTPAGLWDFTRFYWLGKGFAFLKSNCSFVDIGGVKVVEVKYNMTLLDVFLRCAWCKQIDRIVHSWIVSSCGGIGDLLYRPSNTIKIWYALDVFRLFQIMGADPVLTLFPVGLLVRQWKSKETACRKIFILIQVKWTTEL